MTISPEPRLARIAKAVRPFTYPCVDGSERRDQLTGSFASALLEHCPDRHWLRRSPGTRPVSLTPAGQKALAPGSKPPGVPVEPRRSSVDRVRRAA